MAGKSRQNRPSGGAGEQEQSSIDAGGGLTPYQRMQQILAANAYGGHAYLLKNEKPGRIVIRMKLLWVSDHQHKQLKFVRLHFIDADSPEPLEKLQEAFRDTYTDNGRDADTILFTATM